MDTLTAIRSFGKPGYCPVRRVRIRNDRWYAVTFQNVERDARTDYVGLAEGEYSQLLPGAKARDARDSHLNHCNAIEEYTGPVYGFIGHPYADDITDAPIYTSSNTATGEVRHFQELEKAWRLALQRELLHLERRKGESWADEAILSVLKQQSSPAWRYEVRRIR